MPVDAEPDLSTHLLDAVDDAVIATDVTGTIIYWNRRAEALYGWSAAETVGQHISAVSAPAFVEPALALQSSTHAGQGWSGESNVQRRDGRAIMVRVRAFPLHDRAGALLGIASMSRGATDDTRRMDTNRPPAAAAGDARLDTLAKLAVPQLADWCAVHLLQTDSTLEPVAMACADTARLQQARAWIENCLAGDDVRGLPAVLRSGEPTLAADVAAEFRETAPDGRARQLALAAGITSYIIVPLTLRHETLGTITLVAAESGRRFDANALVMAQDLAGHAVALLDRTRLERESVQLKAELEQHVAERTAAPGEAIEKLKQSESMVQTLFRISKKLNATLNVGHLLDDLAQEAIQIVNGESGFAGLRTADGMTVRKFFRGGQAIAYDHTWRSGEGIPGWVLKHGMPYGTSQADADPLLEHDLPINLGVRSVICTPILDSVGDVLGYFDICNKKDQPGFTLDDQELLLALSPAASIAIQNALAYEQRVQAETELSYSYEQLRALAAKLEQVREEQQAEIARELHDQLGQALTALKYDLSHLTTRLVEKDATLAGDARAITAQMDALVKTARRIATELRPGVLDTLGLAASIEWQARAFQTRMGIPCAVDVTEQPLPLTPAQSTALFRIFQETLTNVARHAQARHVHVTLSATESGVTLQVTDDGRGFRGADMLGTHSLGLLGMRERAELLGGSFHIRSAPGRGATAVAFIPYTQRT